MIRPQTVATLVSDLQFNRTQSQRLRITFLEADRKPVLPPEHHRGRYIGQEPVRLLSLWS